MSQLSISDVNQLNEVTFVATFGSVFEHSPWVAQGAWGRGPFANVVALHAAMCQVLRAASAEQQLALIIAHPDLGDRIGGLTVESTSEQASAGLDRLTAAELELFNNSNAAYKAKFGFPFVICARLNDKNAMLSAFARRLQNSPSEERIAAQAEIEKIALLRLQALVN